MIRLGASGVKTGRGGGVAFFSADPSGVPRIPGGKQRSGPQVTVVDRYGKVLATSTEMNRNQVMAQFEQLVKGGAAK
jgi:hypothetical protein